MNLKRMDVLKVALPLAVAALLISVSPSRAQEVVWISATDTWKYYQAGDEPAEDGDGNFWQDLDYSDGSWDSGAAILGFGNGNETTGLTRGAVTYYFRKKITVTEADLSAANQLLMKLLRDDGIVVYINGEELHRDNMEGRVGETVAYDDLASAGVAGSDEKKYFESSYFSEDWFFEGENIIAVEVHQNSPGSSDMSFGMTMEGFSVIPVLGRATPPAPIDFFAARDGDITYTPFDNSSDQPYEIGWHLTTETGFGNAFVDDEVARLNLVNFSFSFGRAMVASGGRIVMVTDVGDTDHDDDYVRDPTNPRISGAHRINISNYENVKVKFDLRAYDDPESSPGISSNTSAKAYIYTSSDGDSFPIDADALVLDLRGGAVSGTTFDLVTDDSSKKVLVPTSEIGDSWKNVSFNDSAWTTGTKGAGYENSNGYQSYFGSSLNLKSQLFNKNPSLFMRIPFTVADPSVLTNLTLGMRYDDGYVAYINGVEVARKNAPGGTPPYNAQASATHADGDAVVFEDVAINEHISDLVAGDNILAIHGLNRPDSSSDMLIAAQLVGINATGGGGGGGGEPESLNDISGPLDGSFTSFQYDIPNTARTVHMKWDLNCNSGNDALILDNILVSGDPLTVDSYQTWVQLNSPYEVDDLGAEGEDPDGDTIENLLEYAFGGDLDTPTSGILPQMGIEEVDGTPYVTLQWRQFNLTTTGGFGEDRTGNFDGYFVRDLSYIPEFSTDAQNWDDDAIAYLIELTESEGEFVDVKVYFDFPLDGLDRAFARLKIRIEEELF